MGSNLTVSSAVYLPLESSVLARRHWPLHANQRGLGKTFSALDVIFTFRLFEGMKRSGNLRIACWWIPLHVLFPAVAVGVSLSILNRMVARVDAFPVESTPVMVFGGMDVRGFKTVLIWRVKPFITYDIQRTYDNCEGVDGSLCMFYTGKRPLKTVDAVVVHHPDHEGVVFRDTDLKRDGPPLWIWWTAESRSDPRKPISNADDFYHLTATFRHDADIFVPYGRLVQRKHPVELNLTARPKGIAWVVSHYRPDFRRTKYVEELRKYIDIDIYGRMTQEQCPGIKPIGSGKKKKEVLRNYKFYLAFENSMHEDYITEKFFLSSLVNQIVPVVLGPPRDCYEKFAPGCFIHVDDFASPRELADFLTKVGSDFQLWSRYLNVHRDFEAQQLEWLSYSMCGICRWLVQNDKRKFNYSKRYNISEWFK